MMIPLIPFVLASMPSAHTQSPLRDWKLAGGTPISVHFEARSAGPRVAPVRLQASDDPRRVPPGWTELKGRSFDVLLPDDLARGTMAVTLEPCVVERSSAAGSQVLLTGNHFAARRVPTGEWGFLDPATALPVGKLGSFCCDQVVAWHEAKDITVWVLQYSRALGENGNVERPGGLKLLVAGADEWANGIWWMRDIPVDDLAPGWEMIDYPQMGFTEEHLHLSVGMVQANSVDGYVWARIPLKGLAGPDVSGCSSFSVIAVDDGVESFLTPAKGASDSMIVAGHLTTDEGQFIRLWEWADTDRQIGDYADIEVEEWGSSDYRCPSPDGSDWLGPDGEGHANVDGTITAGWQVTTAAGLDQVGWMWCDDGQGRFRHPVARTLVLERKPGDPLGQFVSPFAAEPTLWSESFGFAFPAVAVTPGGEVGLSVAFGGGSRFPGHAVGWFDRAKGAWVLEQVREGNAGPSTNEWGDFLGICASAGGGFLASGFWLEGGRGADDLRLGLTGFERP